MSKYDSDRLTSLLVTLIVNYVYNVGAQIIFQNTVYRIIYFIIVKINMEQCIASEETYTKQLRQVIALVSCYQDVI